MSEPREEIYSQERWQNWLERLRDEELDPEDEDSARLLLNLQDDVALAVARIITDYDDGDLEEAGALEELAEIREVVLAEPEFDDEEVEMLLAGVQRSLVCVFYTAEEFVAEGVATETSMQEYIAAAAEAEAEEDLDQALGLTVRAGTQVIDGEELDMAAIEDLEYGLVVDWVNGLDSLQTALMDPEVVEEDD